MSDECPSGGISVSILVEHSQPKSQSISQDTKEKKYGVHTKASRWSMFTRITKDESAYQVLEDAST